MKLTLFQSPTKGAALPENPRILCRIDRGSCFGFMQQPKHWVEGG